jgi:hypothetical protein
LSRNGAASADVLINGATGAIASANIRQENMSAGMMKYPRFVFKDGLIIVLFP